MRSGIFRVRMKNPPAEKRLYCVGNDITGTEELSDRSKYSDKNISDSTYCQLVRYFLPFSDI